MNTALGQIEVHKSLSSFVVYGRFGAVMRADKSKKVIYSNLKETAPEYVCMLEALKEAQA
ncbi:hypothetical protein ACJ6X8_27970 [Pseudomonas alvandae]|uniref:hypothetical protein n=1 Tax=Pseudomonas TaxID=286 RepID=UPI00389A610B